MGQDPRLVGSIGEQADGVESGSQADQLKLGGVLADGIDQLGTPAA